MCSLVNFIVSTSCWEERVAKGWMTPKKSKSPFKNMNFVTLPSTYLGPLKLDILTFLDPARDLLKVSEISQQVFRTQKSHASQGTNAIHAT